MPPPPKTTPAGGFLRLEALTERLGHLPPSYAFARDRDGVVATCTVALEDDAIVGEGRGETPQVARDVAAEICLRDLLAVHDQEN